MIDYVKKLREKADLLEKSGYATCGLVQDYRNCAGTIEKLLKQLQADRWISCSERLPEEEYGTFLVVTEENYYFVAVYTKEHGFRTMDIGTSDEPIAWKPIEPYKGGIDMKECCKTCKYHIYEPHSKEYICCNNRSEFVAEQTEDNHICEEYVERT